MAGIIAVYALVVAVLLAQDIKPPPGNPYSLFSGALHLACGLSVGLTGLAAGYAIGIVGDTVSAGVTQRGFLTITGRASIHAAKSNIRWYGPDTHFWRGTGSLRVSHVILASAYTDVDSLIVALILNTRSKG